ncbi:PilZ domain-containing protein [Candidatus Nitrospira bockiana]
MSGERQDRLPVDLPISFVGDARGNGVVRNLSTSGCKIDSSVTVTEEMLLVLRLAVPGEGSPVVVDVAAVRWVVPPCFGVQFVSMHPAEQERLDRYLDTLTPA